MDLWENTQRTIISQFSTWIVVKEDGWDDSWRLAIIDKSNAAADFVALLTAGDDLAHVNKFLIEEWQRGPNAKLNENVAANAELTDHNLWVKACLSV